MQTTIIKFFFIFFCCISIYTKSISRGKYPFANNCALSFILTLSTYFLSSYIKGFYFIIPLLFLWILVSLQNLNPQASFIAITISFTISFCISALSNFVVIILFFPVFRFPTNYELLAIITGLVQIFTTQRILSIKRFQKGIPFLSSTTFINVTTLFCLILITFIIKMTSNYDNLSFQTFALIIFFFTLAFLIYWWQAQITKSYRRTLELRELESMRTEMAELKLKMQEVMEENEKLARITHRDNTLISTLKNSTVNYLMTDFTNSTDAIAAREKLIANINALSAGRTSLPDNFNEKKARTFDTGVPLLDELLHQMDITAIEKQITFSVHMGTILSDFVPTHVSSDDLVHTVDDLLKNAFKATTTCDKRVVQLQFYKLGKHFVIEVADSGIPFEVRSLVNMGIEKLTTYDDGSGIGLVDIWNTKAKYGATYHIDEYAVATPFTKKISLTFDKKNRYSIRTWRKNEIAQMSKRADLQVYEDLE